jgi:glycosyltransferase involved in cell wall biosynthesis
VIPAVSILLPVRNEARFLPAALASLRRQTFSDWELVAVDDGSTDGTAMMLAVFSREDPRVRVISRPAEGLVTALNAGLAACRAPLVARMDGDDICHPRRLELQLQYLSAHQEVGLVGCGFRHFPRALMRDGMKAYEEWQNNLISAAAIHRDLFVESPFAHPTVVFRRELISGAGGYRDRGWPEDYDLWLRLARSGVIFAKLPQTLLFWRDRPERLTRSSAHCSADAFRACKAHHLGRMFLRGEKKVTLWGAGMEGKAWRKTLAGKGIEVRRWIDVDPRKIGQIIHGAPVVPPGDLVPGEEKILITIGAKGARPQVREWAARAGLAEGEDFLCVT